MPRRPARRPGHVLLLGRALRSGLAIRAVFALAGAAVLLAVGIGMAYHGIAPHSFPPFIAGGGTTTIESYSGPWLSGAIGVGTLAGLLLVSAVTDLWRRRLIRPGPPTADHTPPRRAGTMER